MLKMRICWKRKWKKRITLEKNRTIKAVDAPLRTAYERQTDDDCQKQMIRPQTTQQKQFFFACLYVD